MEQYTKYDQLCAGIAGARFYHYGLESIADAALDETLFKIAREIMDNADKHAQATEIYLQLIVEAHRVSLLVDDNGCGFDTQAPTAGNGLKRIREMVDARKGYIDVLSDSGRGTEVMIEFKTRKKALSHNS
jgi:signal transduction histidine kinase